MFLFGCMTSTGATIFRCMYDGFIRSSTTKIILQFDEFTRVGVNVEGPKHYDIKQVVLCQLWRFFNQPLTLYVSRNAKVKPAYRVRRDFATVQIIALYSTTTKRFPYCSIVGQWRGILDVLSDGYNCIVQRKSSRW